ncbi:MAG TPA: Gfo/Idh/MocA family oxidoreductase [Bryobacteraceae bacterium]|jgi:predicted dehydrogenase
MNRRDFLEVAALSAALPQRAWSANDKVNVAVVGVGNRGSTHVKDFVRRQDANLAAVCDVNTAQTERAVQTYYAARNVKPKVYGDLRKLYEDPGIDAVIIATPNHWHALATIWACQGGKDVYVEKPVSYNPFEGERMVAAARRYKRVVQGGMQRRSITHKKRAIELLRQGTIGDVYMARGICYKRRPSIGHKPDGPVPPGVNWDLFLGPAPMRAYNENRHKYNWHWFWDTGNGDIGNQGIHELDYIRWGMNKAENPKSVCSFGKKYIYDDDQETPNTQIAVYDYGDCEISFEVRGLFTGSEGGMELRGDNFIGVMFFGSKGYMVVEDSGFKTFFGEKREPGEAMAIVEGKQDENTAHVSNFLNCVRARTPEKLVADVEQAAISADLVHTANISYRTGRKLKVRSKPTLFEDDGEANQLLTRHPYRSPYIVS